MLVILLPLLQRHRKLSLAWPVCACKVWQRIGAARPDLLMSSCTRSFQQACSLATLVMLTLRVRIMLSSRKQSLISFCFNWIPEQWHADLQVATTVGAMAEAGLFHGDISPANILQTGHLIDFQTLWHAQVCAGFPIHSFKRLAQLFAGWTVCPAC